MYSTYTRLKVTAVDSPTDVIRAAKNRLRKEVWYSRQFREQRHKFYREMLGYHDKARKVFSMATVGF